MIGAVHTVVPRDSQGAGPDANVYFVALVKTIVVVRIHRKAFEAPSVPPGINKKPPGAAHDALHQIAPDHGGLVVGNVFGRVQPAIQEKSRGEDEGNGNQAGEEMLERFDVLAIAGAAVQKDGESQGEEKNQAIKDQHSVEIKWRVDLAEIRKEKRTDEEESHLTQETAAKDEFGGGGGEAARRTLIGGTLGSTIQATHHRE